MLTHFTRASSMPLSLATAGQSRRRRRPYGAGRVL